MTSLPAETLGLDGRGVVARGAFADIVVLDAAIVGDEATLSQPRQKARGIEAVFVNGTLAYDGDGMTKELAGSVLRARP
jgi:N-acyl-D-aspartate/D-glutamate deacylase